MTTQPYQIKQTNIINAKKHEIDKVLINQIYNIREKKKRTYNIIEKKTIFNKEITNNFKSVYQSQSDNYFSNYQYFREYLMTGYTPEFTLNEIDKIKSLISFSRQLRLEIREHFNMPIDNLTTYESLLEKGQEMNSSSKKKTSSRRLSSIFTSVKAANNFVKICKLLKLKTNKKELQEDKYQFRLYSQFNKESDVYSIPQFENFISVKYYNQNRKLTKLYHTENMFIECVTDVKKRLKQRTSIFESGSDNLEEIKKSLRVPTIQSLFSGRDIEYFKQIDTFVSFYKENYFQMKNKEKELFKGIYNILQKCNYSCVNFLSYLYSKSYMFKYIYDIFTIEAKHGFIDKTNIQLIPRDMGNEPFLNDSTRIMFIENNNNHFGSPLSISEGKQIIENKEKNVNIKVNNAEVFAPLFGCLFFEKIAFLNEDITNDIKSKINDFSQLQYDCYLLLSRDKKCVVFKNTMLYSGNKYYYVKEDILKVSFLVVEECNLFSNIDSSKEQIFILKIESEGEKNFLMRMKKKSIGLLENVNKEYKIIKKKVNDDILEKLMNYNMMKMDNNINSNRNSNINSNRSSNINRNSNININSIRSSIINSHRNSNINSNNNNNESYSNKSLSHINSENTLGLENYRMSHFKNELRGSNIAVREDKNNINFSSYTGADNLSESK